MVYVTMTLCVIYVLHVAYTITNTCDFLVLRVLVMCIQCVHTFQSELASLIQSELASLVQSELPCKITKWSFFETLVIQFSLAFYGMVSYNSVWIVCSILHFIVLITV